MMSNPLNHFIVHLLVLTYDVQLLKSLHCPPLWCPTTLTIFIMSLFFVRLGKVHFVAHLYDVQLLCPSLWCPNSLTTSMMSTFFVHMNSVQFHCLSSWCSPTSSSPVKFPTTLSISLMSTFIYHFNDGPTTWSIWIVSNNFVQQLCPTLLSFLISSLLHHHLGSPPIWGPTPLIT